MDNYENAASEFNAVQAQAAKAFEAPAHDMRETMRSLVEKGIADSRVKYAQAKSVAAEATAALESSYGAAQSGTVAFNVKALEAMKAGFEANFEFLKSIAAVKSASELMTLNAAFARKGFEEASARGKELAELASKVAMETVAPLQAQAAKGFQAAV